MRDEEQDSHTGEPTPRPSLTESGASSVPQASQKLSVAPTGSPQAKHTVAAGPAGSAVTARSSGGPRWPGLPAQCAAPGRAPAWPAPGSSAPARSAAEQAPAAGRLPRRHGIEPGPQDLGRELLPPGGVKRQAFQPAGRLPQL